MTPLPAPDPSQQQEIIRRLREAVQRALQRSAPSDQPDAQSKEEQKDLEAERKRAEIRGTNQDTDERKKYAHRTFCLVCAWLAGIAGILILDGFHIGGYSLGDEVLMALIGGTTTGVVGVFLIVARYLFPRR